MSNYLSFFVENPLSTIQHKVQCLELNPRYTKYTVQHHENLVLVSLYNAKCSAQELNEETQNTSQKNTKHFPYYPQGITSMYHIIKLQTPQVHEVYEIQYISKCQGWINLIQRNNHLRSYKINFQTINSRNPPLSNICLEKVKIDHFLKNSNNHT